MRAHAPDNQRFNFIVLFSLSFYFILFAREAKAYMDSLVEKLAPPWRFCVRHTKAPWTNSPHQPHLCSFPSGHPVYCFDRQNAIDREMDRLHYIPVSRSM